MPAWIMRMFAPFLRTGWPRWSSAQKMESMYWCKNPWPSILKLPRKMISTARAAGIQLGVVSQHRFDDSVLFLKKALTEERLGRILEADAYVKWHRTDEYYARPVKGSWLGEGGGALIGQAIHQVDVLLYLVGAVDEVFGYWQLGATHKIESEDCVCAVMRYASGATGVIQAATALWPGYPERVEIHGTKGSAIVTGDQLTTWDVRNDSGEPAPVAQLAKSGASDPMAISTVPFERQLSEFGEACTLRRPPSSSGVEGYHALELVKSIYTSCAEARKVKIAVESEHFRNPPLAKPGVTGSRRWPGIHRLQQSLLL